MIVTIPDDARQELIKIRAEADERLFLLSHTQIALSRGSIGVYESKIRPVEGTVRERPEHMSLGRWVLQQERRKRVLLAELDAYDSRFAQVASEALHALAVPEDDGETYTVALPSGKVQRLVSGTWQDLEREISA